MASYKVVVEGSTLGPVGTVVTDADIEAHPADLELLVFAGIVEPATSKKEKD